MNNNKAKANRKFGTAFAWTKYQHSLKSSEYFVNRLIKDAYMICVWLRMFRGIVNVKT